MGSITIPASCLKLCGSCTPDWGPWYPDPSTICDGVSFTQYRDDANGCESQQSRPATGTGSAGSATASALVDYYIEVTIYPDGSHAVTKAVSYCDENYWDPSWGDCTPAYFEPVDVVISGCPPTAEQIIPLDDKAAGGAHYISNSASW